MNWRAHTLTWLMMFSWLSISSSRGSAVGCCPPRWLSSALAAEGASLSSLPGSAASAGAGSAFLSASRASSPLRAQHKNSSGSLRHISPQDKLTMDSTPRRSRPASGNDQVAEAKPEGRVAHVQRSSGLSLDNTLNTATQQCLNISDTLKTQEKKKTLQTRKPLYSSVTVERLDQNQGEKVTEGERRARFCSGQ